MSRSKFRRPRVSGIATCVAAAVAVAALVSPLSRPQLAQATGVIELQVAGRGGVDGDASAVVLNVAAVRASSRGHVRVWPCGEDRPTATSVNYQAGEAISNATVVEVGEGGKVCLWSSTPTDLVVDVNGAFAASSGLETFVPSRLLDTRNSGGSSGVVELQVAGRGGVDGDASAVVLNVAAVRASSRGHVRVWPCGEDRPTATSVNYQAGEAISNATVVEVGEGGKVCLWSSTPTDLVVDVNGAFAASSGLETFVPSRLLDTRNSGGSSGVVELQVAGRGGVDGDASAVVLNVAAVRASSRGHVRVWPCGEDRPTATSVNYQAGEAISNATVVGVGEGGKVCLWSSTPTDLVVDVNGAFAASSGLETFVPSRLLDTRPTTPTASGRFGTLAPGAALPSGSECSGRVRPAAEVRPANAQANQTRGTSPNGRYPRVDGNFTGTTDEIIQWVACKWGIDEDLVRAQVVSESYWFQRTLGDFTSNPDACIGSLGIGNYPGYTGQCPESVGLGQVRWLYHLEAFEDDNAIRSSAYNLDYTYAGWRDCFEGNTTWLNDAEGRGDYGAGDAVGCQGVWFSGRWYTQAAVDYIAVVQGHVRDRTWETSNFLNAR